MNSLILWIISIPVLVNYWNALYYCSELIIPLTMIRLETMPWSGWINVLLLPILIWLVLKNFRLKRSLLAKSKEGEEGLTQNSLLERRIMALEKIVKHQEEEREQLAKKIHDDVGGLLALTFLQEEINVGEIESLNISKSGSEIIQDVTDQLRSISHEMMPEAFYHFGLKDALTDLSLVLSGDSLEIETDIVDELPVNDQKYVSWILYKMIRELIRKIQLLQGVSKISVSLQLDELNQILLSIQDDANVPLDFSEDYDNMDFISACTTFFDGQVEYTNHSTTGNNLQFQLPRNL